MQVKTILNHVHKIKGFVYGKIRFTGEQIAVDVRPRKGSRPTCSGCDRPGAGYDTLAPRHFQFVPLWAISLPLLPDAGKQIINRLKCRVIFSRE